MSPVCLILYFLRIVDCFTQHYSQSGKFVREIICGTRPAWRRRVPGVGEKRSLQQPFLNQLALTSFSLSSWLAPLSDQVWTAEFPRSLPGRAHLWAPQGISGSTAAQDTWGKRGVSHLHTWEARIWGSLLEDCAHDSVHSPPQCLPLLVLQSGRAWVEFVDLMVGPTALWLHKMTF